MMTLELHRCHRREDTWRYVRASNEATLFSPVIVSFVSQLLLLSSTEEQNLLQLVLSSCGCCDFKLSPSQKMISSFPTRRRSRLRPRPRPITFAVCIWSSLQRTSMTVRPTHAWMALPALKAPPPTAVPVLLATLASTVRVSEDRSLIVFYRVELTAFPTSCLAVDLDEKAKHYFFLPQD